MRARLGIGKDDIACAIIARLTPHEKFDPLPLYLALARAQAQLGRRFHLLLCGQFRDEYARRVFTTGAQAMMPDAGFYLLDGASAADRKATLSGADIFLFPIDNVQRPRCDPDWHANLVRASLRVRCHPQRCLRGVRCPTRLQ